MIPICHVQALPIMGDEQRTMLDIIDEIPRSVYEHHVICPGNGPLTAELAQRSVRVHVQPTLSPTLNPWRDMQAYWSLRKVFERENIRLVHNHSGKARFVAALAARHARVPWIVNHIHGYAFDAYSPVWQSFALKRLESWTAKLASTTVFANHSDRKLALAHNLAEPRTCHTIYNGTRIVSEDAPADGPLRRRLRLSEKLNDRDVAIGVSTRFRGDKQPLIVPEIAHCLSQRDMSRNWKILVADSGQLAAQLRTTVAARRLAQHFCFVDASDDLALLPASDILLHPSLREGLPLPLIDALAVGVPIVASDIAGNREVVTRKTGCLVEPKDPDDYAEKLAELIDAPLERHKLGMAGRARAAELFDVSRNMQQVLALYDQLSGVTVAARQAA